MKFTRKRLSFAAILLVLLFGWLWYDHFIEDGNFTIVTPHTLYRSGTLSHHEWKEILRENPPFRSVLNLRGKPHKADDREWYVREESLSEKSGISFYTFGISANTKPTLAQMNEMVELMRTAPKPLLIHCKSGSDRTGLATALYLYAIEGKPAEEAARNLSIRFGHFPWLTSHTGAMDAAFAEYVAANPHK